MGKKAQVRKKIVSQNTLDSKKIRVGAKGEKIKCDYCNSKVLDLARHLLKCYRNPGLLIVIPSKTEKHLLIYYKLE